MQQKNHLLDAVTAAARVVRNRNIILELTGLTSMKLVSKWFNEFDELKAAGTTLTRDQYVEQENKKLFKLMQEYEDNHKTKTNETTDNDKERIEELHQRTC
jgi:hypothetical protein